MKTYPSIPTWLHSKTDISIVAFDKLDGSNIRGEWSKKNKFYKFGTRHRLLGEDEKPVGEAISLIKSKYEKQLSDIFAREHYESAVVFFEFFGEHSAFGQHTNEQHNVVLFDVAPYKQGILEPRKFLKTFGHLDIPNIVYEGWFNHNFAVSVINKTLDGITCEGVVCKGANDKKTRQPVLFKIKTNEWLEKLKQYCAGNIKLFNELI